jgi:serine/alanine adding enzyme
VKASATTEVVQVERDLGDPAGWDRFVRSPGQPTTAFHLAAWREVIADTLGAAPIYLHARGGGGDVAGVLPLFRVTTPLLGRYLVSLPFLNAGGPLGSPAAKQALVRAAVAEARHARVDLLELRCRQYEALGLPASSRRIRVTLPLPQTEEELWAAFPSKLRSQIRRPLKEGMETRFGPDQVEPFHEVFQRNMRDLGTPVLPRSFFTAMARQLSDEVVFGAVYWQGNPVAAGCGFTWQGEFEMTWASSLREVNRHAPNMLLYWSFMVEVLHRGGCTFDFGRCVSGSSTHRFKRQWGGLDRELPWLQWSPNGLAATPDGTSAMMRFAANAWRRLPLPLANRLGPCLAAKLP